MVEVPKLVARRSGSVAVRPAQAGRIGARDCGSQLETCIVEGPKLVARKRLRSFEPGLAWIGGIVSCQLLRLAICRPRGYNAIGVGSNIKKRNRAGRLALSHDGPLL